MGYENFLLSVLSVGVGKVLEVGKICLICALKASERGADWGE